MSDDNLAFTISEHQDYTEEDDMVVKRKTHTLEIGLESGKLDITFPSGESLVFDSVQFHAHAPSEHTVDGEFHDLEIHFVHTHPDGDKFAVIGVFFDVGQYENPFIAQLGFELAEEEENTIGAVDVATFLEEIDTENYWHYDGSFTTPPCTEGVKFFVMKEVQSISQDQLDAFHSYSWGNGDFENGEGNNRRTQPLNDRTLYNISASGADEGESEEGEGANGEAEGEGATEESGESNGGNNNVDISIAFNVDVGQKNADE